MVMFRVMVWISLGLGCPLNDLFIVTLLYLSMKNHIFLLIHSSRSSKCQVRT